MFILQQIVEIA